MNKLITAPDLAVGYYVDTDLTVEQAASLRDTLVEPGVVDNLHVTAERGSLLNSYGHNVLVAGFRERYFGGSDLEAYSKGIVLAEVLSPLLNPDLDPYDDSGSQHALTMGASDIADQFRLYEQFIGMSQQERHEKTPVLYALMRKVLVQQELAGRALELGLGGGSVFLKYHEFVDRRYQPDDFPSI